MNTSLPLPELQSQLLQFLFPEQPKKEPPLYERLNALRSWFNQHLTDFEIYLEDQWNEYEPGETRIEYILRSLSTHDELPPLAYDSYHNHQDGKGVWHLGDYRETILLLESPAAIEAIIQFIEQDRARLPKR